MPEDQNIEWKESWRDEYLKWVCGFANAQGGVLEIGKNDKGDVVGVSNAGKLLVDLPNKMRDLLGIIADVDLIEEAGNQYVRITVEPYPYPASYRGEYHVRSGSTKQMLKGAALRYMGRRPGEVPLILQQMALAISVSRGALSLWALMASTISASISTSLRSSAVLKPCRSGSCSVST